MENLIYLFVGGSAFIILLAIMEPHRFIPEGKGKKKLVGSTYWGAYSGTPVEQTSEVKIIELRKPSKRERYTAGSSTYSKGRGVSMSGK